MKYNGYPTDLRSAGLNSNVIVKNAKLEPIKLLNSQGVKLGDFKGNECKPHDCIKCRTRRTCLRIYKDEKVYKI